MNIKPKNIFLANNLKYYKKMINLRIVIQVNINEAFKY